MDDAQYRELIRPPAPWDNIKWTLKTAFLKPHLDFFVNSFIRINGLAHTPALLCYFATRDRRMEANAFAAVSNLNQIPVARLSEARMTNAVLANINAQVAALNALSNEGTLPLLFNLGVTYVESTMRQNPDINNSMAAIYSAIMFESWIAFEAMASDLWVTALDKGPAILANTVANSKELKKPDDAITPKLLRELEYDARKEFGLFLRETRRVSFQKLSDIRITYKIAFGEAASLLFTATNDAYIEALSAFRNIFAHRAGRADKDFVNQVKKFAEFRQIRKDDQIELDAITVRTLFHASAHMGLALLEFVDNYIAEHNQQT